MTNEVASEVVQIVDDLLIYLKMKSGGELPKHDNGVDRALRFLANAHLEGQPITMSLAMIMRERGMLPDDER